MNTAEILTAVEDIILDSGYERAGKLIRSLNRGLLEIAWLVYLPVLQSHADVAVTPDTIRVDPANMPSDYYHGLYSAWNQMTSRHCAIWYSRLSLEGYFDGTGISSGDVEAVVEEGGTLHVRKSPREEQALTLKYYAKPTELTDSQASAPDCLPEPFHYSLLVNYVVADVFTEIEDGVEGQMRNLQFYSQQYQQSLVALRASLPDSSRPRRKIPRKRIWF